MKKCNTVVNARLYKAGKKSAQWGTTGMNWAKGPGRDQVISASYEALKSPAKLQRIGRSLANVEVLTQSAVTRAIMAECYTIEA